MKKWYYWGQDHLVEAKLWQACQAGKEAME